MIPFIGLGTYVRALLLTILFIEVCVAFCLTLWSFMQRPLLPKIISPVSAISAILFLLPYSAYILRKSKGSCQRLQLYRKVSQSSCNFRYLIHDSRCCYHFVTSDLFLYKNPPQHISLFRKRECR